MRNKFTEDTIAAVATPSGTGAISVIRVSGPGTFKAVDSIFSGKDDILTAESHTIHYGKIKDKSGSKIDDVLISVFRNPHSYTGEDVIEISTHGNAIITKRILEALLNENVRLAEPGEFTRRAFLNNRIDLAQAEAVADIINSRTEVSLLGARSQLDGLLSQKVEELRTMLVNASSFVELELDFAEEDLEFINSNELRERINNILREIDKLLATYSFGKVIKDGVNVALVGKPNVGKSSLLNYILKESRAIVSHIPGTTRDIIREDATIDGILFRLFDTAGLRASEDEIEKEGVIRSREAVRNADLVLFMNDVEQGFSEDIFDELKKTTQEERIICVLNKIDKNRNSSLKSDINISAKTGQGIESLFSLLKEKALGNSNYSEKSAVVSNLRHYNCLKKAKESLLNAMESTNNKLSGEFISVDLRNAESNLAEIIGAVTSEDILNNIFATFCIGK
jgi:tRNA modification GTPase